MDFGAQDCDFDQIFSCYTLFKSESPNLDTSIQPNNQCPLHKSHPSGQVVSGQYHHQDHHPSIHQFHSNTSLLQQIPSIIPSPRPPSNHDQTSSYNSKFGCTLMAQTLPAVKLTDEQITCLNQGQSYDIKLKKHSDTNPAKYYKSNIRLMFHHRRLQHSEQEQFQSWLAARPDQRLIDLDVPLGYNTLNTREDPRTPNMITITWSGHNEASVSIKINCISTEFTAKKHGGEKGVPFRLQVDTYAVMGDEEHDTHLVHRSYCLVKVFKPNGADRKNKNDAMKLSKVPIAERDLYHPTYEVTVFSEIQRNQSAFSPVEWMAEDNMPKKQSTQQNRMSVTNSTSQCQSTKSNGSPVTCLSPEPNIFQDNDKSWNEICKSESQQMISQPILTRSSSSLFTDSSPSPPSTRTPLPQDGNSFAALNNTINPDKVPSQVTFDTTSPDLRNWLRSNNFEKWITAFEHYSGREILMLSKEDFTKICGVAEGIRMFYKIYSGMGPSTKKSLYISYLAGNIAKRRLYMRKNFSSESLESPSPSSVSSTVTTGSCSNLLASNINDMSLDHRPVILPVNNNDANQQNHNTKKGYKRSRDGSETRVEDENNNLDLPHSKKNKCSDERDVELPVYLPIHLKWLTYAHLLEKVSETFHIPNHLIAQIYIVDRDGTDIPITDEIVERLKDHSIFTMDILTENASRKKYVLLIPLIQKDC